MAKRDEEEEILRKVAKGAVTSRGPRISMLFRRSSLRGLLLSLVAFPAAPALSQNLLVNPGFDRDLARWTVRIVDGSSSAPSATAFAEWVASDAAGSPGSGGAALHAKAVDIPGATAAVGQCVSVRSPSLVSFGARFLVLGQRLSTITTTVTFFSTPDCSGAKVSTVTAPPLPTSVQGIGDSGGKWLPVQSEALVPASARSALVEVSASGSWTWSYGDGFADVVADDAFFTVAPSQQTVSFLPSAAWISGAGAYWSTHLTLVNSGATDAAVTLKWLGHDSDGRGGAERAYLVRAGQTMDLPVEEWEISHQQNYGAILVTSSSPSLLLQSETSTSLSSGGTVGQALAAFGAADFASVTPKTLAPIRENPLFRTNLVLANPTEIPVTARIALFAPDGTPIGTRDVDLPPLGMTQINRVASAFGATSLDAGRISVSTPTSGGQVAAYASVIDNTTNDPRTLLPR